MKHYAHLARFMEKEPFLEKGALFNGFLECLSPQEACDLLWEFLELDYLTKLPLLKKISKDMAAEHLECHNDLIFDLLTILDETIGKEKQRALTALGHFFSFTSEKNRLLILRALLLSDSVKLQRRANQLLRTAWQPAYETILRQAWDSQQNSEIAEMVISHLDDKFLIDHFLVLESIVAYSWAFTRLYLKTGANYPKVLNRLQVIDGITYSYILVKLNKRLRAPKAISLFEENKYDDRLGLLIWSFGKMKLRPALVHIERQLESLPLGLLNCTECENGHLFRQGLYVDKSKFNEFGLPMQFRIFRCFDCSKVIGLYKGRFEVLFDEKSPKT